MPPKLVLCVIDAMAPAMLERAISAGVAPMLEKLIHNGRYVPDCVAAFPSVTPVCAASMTPRKNGPTSAARLSRKSPATSPTPLTSLLIV